MLYEVITVTSCSDVPTHMVNGFRADIHESDIPEVEREEAIGWFRWLMGWEPTKCGVLGEAYVRLTRRISRATPRT